MEVRPKDREFTSARFFLAVIVQTDSQGVLPQNIILPFGKSHPAHQCDSFSTRGIPKLLA